MKRIFIVFISILFFMPMVLNGQKQFNLVEKESIIRIEGTSSLHDWEMEVEKMNGNLLLVGESARISQFKGVLFECRSGSLKSHSSIMDGKAMEALKAEKYPVISFRMTEVRTIRSESGSYTADIAGILSIAGKSKNIVLKSTGSYKEGSVLTANGSIDLRMTDFDVDPPKAMMGTLKTGDQVTVSFNLKFIG